MKISAPVSSVVVHCGRTMAGLNAIRRRDETASGLNDNAGTCYRARHQRRDADDVRTEMKLGSERGLRTFAFYLLICGDAGAGAAAVESFSYSKAFLCPVCGRHFYPGETLKFDSRDG